MEISAVTLTLLLLFFPGIVASQLFDSPSTHRATATGLSTGATTVLAGLLTPGEEMDFVAIASSTGIGIVLSILAAKAYNDKWLERLASAARVSKKFGDQDVWSYMHNSGGFEWVTVRDWSKGVAYQGWVEAFSETSKDCEMLLRNVAVSSLGDGKELYRLKALYVARGPRSLTLEIQDFADGPAGGQADGRG